MSYPIKKYILFFDTNNYTQEYLNRIKSIQDNTG